jgi:hypothetical protein
MPIYEYIAPTKGKVYSFFAHSSKYADKIPFCPDGKQFKMVKLLSGFSITGKGTDSSSDGPGSLDSESPFDNLDERQTERVMKELESAVGGMDDDNPDPKQMGALMRKVCALTGEKMDEGMEEVVRKLEEGTDPNELEERMADFDLDSSEEATSEPDESRKGIQAVPPKKLVRDPVLYELNDYI